MADGAVQTHLFVMRHVARDVESRLFQRDRTNRPQAISLDGPEKPFQLLRIVRTGPQLGHAAQADELLEVLGQEPRPVVADDPRPGDAFP